MADDGKAAERKRLAEALRANLKRRKAAPKPGALAREPSSGDAASKPASERG